MPGLPGGSLGREDGRGGSGGIGLLADKGVPGRAGDEGPENGGKVKFLKNLHTIIKRL